MGIQKNSCAKIQFSLVWQENDATHEDVVFVSNVNMWRDALPKKLQSSLIGLQKGDTVSLNLPAEDFGERYDPSLVKILRRSQIKNEIFPGKEVHVESGRFYPKGMLSGIANIFSANRTPFRVAGKNGVKFTADLNTPLAGRPVTVQARVIEVRGAKCERGGSAGNLEEYFGTGPGMQARWNNQATDFFYAGAMGREDDSDDELFYASPRFVHHMDSTSRRLIGDLYARLVPRDARVLDLMSSWESHIPEDMALKSMHGLGLNAEELARNPRLSSYSVADLNKAPGLEFPDNFFDAALCTASVEYLTRPDEVFSSVLRVLQPGGIFVVTFSNRWFFPKAVKVWGEMHEFERMGYVAELFRRAGGFMDLSTYSMRGLPRPSDDKYAKELIYSDSVFAVWGAKKT